MNESASFKLIRQQSPTNANIWATHVTGQQFLKSAFNMSLKHLRIYVTLSLKNATLSSKSILQEVTHFMID
jgi:hypothetical protein